MLSTDAAATWQFFCFLTHLPQSHSASNAFGFVALFSLARITVYLVFFLLTHPLNKYLLWVASPLA